MPLQSVIAVMIVIELFIANVTHFLQITVSSFDVRADVTSKIEFSTGLDRTLDIFFFMSCSDVVTKV